MTSYTFQLISQDGKLFRTHSFRSKVVLLAERNIMLRDQSERSKWSRKQAQNLILHIFLIIIIIIRCSGMFRDVPGCSGMFHVPGFIDGRILGPKKTEPVSRILESSVRVQYLNNQFIIAF